MDRAFYLFLQYEGLNIITDPIWARRLGFEKRIGQPGIPLADIPPIDLILISHSHYDHLHIASIRKLYRAGTTLVVPAGLKRKMLRKGFPNCQEMQWWDEISLGAVKLTFVPTQHWTRRTPFDTNSSHWGGYVLQPADPQKHPEGRRVRRSISCFRRTSILPETAASSWASRRSADASSCMLR